MSKDEMVLWPHWLGHEFEQSPEVVMYSEAGHVAVHGLAESDTTEWLK